MKYEWAQAQLADICEHSAFGPRFSGALYATDGNVATLRTTDISADGRIDYESMPLARLELTRFQQHILRKHDLVITRTGRVGTTAVFNEFRLPVLPGAFLIRFRLREEIAEPNFYRYYFNSPAGQRAIHSTASGSVQKNLNITTLHGLTIPVPPLTEQRQIAGVLGALDAKIEHNRSLAAHLDSFVALKFRSSGFVLSDEVEPPRGWRRVTVGDVAEINTRSHTANNHPDEIEYIDISNTAPRSIATTTRLAWADAPSRARRVVRAGDTLVSTVRPERRSMVFVPETRDGLTASTAFAVVTPKEVSPTLVYRVVTSDECIRQLSAAATGSAYPAVNPKVIEEWAFALPPDGGAGFEQVAGPAERLRWRLLEECRSLASLRDELLPKLVSGKIRVPDAYDPDDAVGTVNEAAGTAARS